MSTLMTDTAKQSTTSRTAARPKPAHAWFFPAAALYAATVVPLSLIAMRGGGWLPGLASSLGHAHEMLFGFALAVVAGYLLGPQPRTRLVGLFGVWLGARLLFVLSPEPWLAGLFNAAFAAGLAVLVAPKFLSAAKKLRNQAFAPILIGICVAVAAFQLARGSELAWIQRVVVLDAVLLFALLMLFMGGRIIAPAAAGALYRRGIDLEARVQPRIEGALILLSAAAVLLLLAPGGQLPAAIAVGAAGVLAVIRLLRWRLWDCRDRPDLICLGVGYGWLAIGLIATGISLLTGQYLTAALHLITVGALGTLTTGVMARVRLQRAKREPAKTPSLIVIAVLIAAATLLRAVGAVGLLDAYTGYWLASAAWSMAYLLVLRLLLSVPAR